jgi:hypothetical protein
LPQIIKQGILKVCISTERLYKRSYFIPPARGTVLVWICLIIAFKTTLAQKAEKPLPPLSVVKGKLQYIPDSLGNRIPDFSYCGYKAGEHAIPDAAIKVIVPVGDGDATLRIQSAIDYVSRLPMDANGLRGAVLLQKGYYKVEGSLLLHTSGVVLRGAGFGSEGTIIAGAGKDRTTLICIAGKNDKSIFSSISIAGEYVPVNAKAIHIGAHNFKKGDNIIITRPSSKEWIEALGAGHFGGGITSLGWKPGQRNIEWARTITAVSGNVITIDAPITTALDKKYGGGTVASFRWPGRISNCGIENIQLISDYDKMNEKDEDHRWMAVTIDNATDVWVRQVSFKYFAGSAVAVYENASRVTVEDCISQQPVSEIGGERRNTFFTAGQQTLFQRCYAEYGMHDFATGFCAAGPNAFVQCESHLPYSFSGAIDSWASGVLFDIVNVDGNALRFGNRGQDANGAGWAAANSLFWNCSAARIDCYKPPTAQNWSFGSWSQFAGDGYWGESNNIISPRSLYYTQLGERLSKNVDNLAQILIVPTEASSSPSVETANELTKQSIKPRTQLKEWIDEATKRSPISANYEKGKVLSDIEYKRFLIVAESKIPPSDGGGAAPMQIQNGWLVRGNKLVTGNQSNVPWWSGSARPYALRNSGMAITRFVPGKTGRGLTDDLNEMTDSMIVKNIVAVDQNYGLWYDRRRDDHERIKRMDGDVWTPFYELPFARSGKETAWDGLSKYDLTKYNYWYWNRLKQYADLADQKGLLLIHQNYFQHNIIEAGAHYADFPWRTANNINNTGFPEPVPYAGDKRIFMAEQFYDTSHPVRRELHKKYIRQCLGNFANNNSVIQFIGEEFTGPLHFVQFWLNTIGEWQKENGKKQIIGLSVTKDVQDEILNDPYYSSLIDVIDIKYWYYQADGKLYAPRGGQNLAPRQHARLLKPGNTSSQQVYRAVLEYKLRFPGKAVMYSADAWDRNGWAVLMAGGSLPNLKIRDEDFLQAVSTMQPVATDTSVKQWILKNDRTGYIIYDMTSDNVMVDLSKSSGSYSVIWMNTINEDVQKDKRSVKAGKMIALTKPKTDNWILWLKKR